MKKYMVVTLADDGEQFAYFTDSLERAEQHRMDSDVSMGWYSEVYERVTDPEEGNRYELLYC